MEMAQNKTGKSSNLVGEVQTNQRTDLQVIYKADTIALIFLNWEEQRAGPAILTLLNKYWVNISRVASYVNDADPGPTIISDQLILKYLHVPTGARVVIQCNNNNSIRTLISSGATCQLSLDNNCLVK